MNIAAARPDEIRYVLDLAEIAFEECLQGTGKPDERRLRGVLDDLREQVDMSEQKEEVETTSGGQPDARCNLKGHSGCEIRLIEGQRWTVHHPANTPTG